MAHKLRDTSEAEQRLTEAETSAAEEWLGCYFPCTGCMRLKYKGQARVEYHSLSVVDRATVRFYTYQKTLLLGTPLADLEGVPCQDSSTLRRQGQLAKAGKDLKINVTRVACLSEPESGNKEL